MADSSYMLIFDDRQLSLLRLSINPMLGRGFQRALAGGDGGSPFLTRSRRLLHRECLAIATELFCLEISQDEHGCVIDTSNHSSFFVRTPA